MCFEVFLKIIVAFFAVFGVYSFYRLLFCVVFGYDNIRIVLEVDNAEVAENIERYLREARENALALCGKQVAVVIKNEYQNDKLVKKLERHGIKYYVI